MKRVTLRFKKSTGSKTYLFLDYYPPFLDPKTNRRKRQEYLGMYIYSNSENDCQREYNKRVIDHARKIEAKRALAAIDRDMGAFNYKNLDADFLRYFKIKSEGRSKGWLETYDYFYEYVNGVCRFSDLNVHRCRRFCEFMLGEKGLSTRLCDKHFGYFRDILREAYQDGYILDNLCLILN